MAIANCTEEPEFVTLLNDIRLTEAHISTRFLISTFIFFPLDINIPCGFMLTTCLNLWSVKCVKAALFNISNSIFHFTFSSII